MTSLSYAILVKLLQKKKKKGMFYVVIFYRTELIWQGQ